MSVVSTDNIREHMVLSDEVKDVKGRLLLKKSQKIESNHIRILKMWGVTEVNVVGDASREEGTETSIDQALIEKVTEDTRHDFVHVDLDHPAISELFRLAVLFRSSQDISKKENIAAPDEYEDSAVEVKPDVRNKIMQQEVKLPEIPSIVFELNEIIADPLSSADDIAQIVSKSPSLATVLLKIVNSSFYGFPSKIDSISRAVTMIGTREIGSLALGISVIALFEGLPKELIDMHGFLKHGFACGIISRILAAQKNLPQTEQLFVSGLLHDIGRAVIYQYFPGHANVLLYRSLKSGRLLYQEERDCLGCRHTDIGSYLLKKWKLPFNLEDNICCHHNPSTADDPDQAVIVQMADIISNALGLGTSGERFVPTLDHEAWDSLGLSPSCFHVVIRQGVNQLTVFEHFLQQEG